MKQTEITAVRKCMRELVRELGLMRRGTTGSTLSPLQCHVLLELREENLGVTELARRLRTEKSSMSRTLANLEASGLVARFPDAHDKRGVLFSLTEFGEESVASLNVSVDQFFSDAMSLLSDNELAGVKRSALDFTRALASARKQRDMAVVIRPITSEDNQAIAEVIRQSFRDNKIDHLEGVSLHDPQLSKLSEVYQGDQAGYWVAEIDSRVVGGVGIAQLQGADKPYCEMQKLYLDKAFTGLGIGRRLIALSIEKAREMGYQYCYLETLEELSSAVSLYEDFGFELLAESLGDTGHNSCEIRMLKTL